MKQGKVVKPNPSQLPKLSPEEVAALEKKLRLESDAWGWIISPREESIPPAVHESSWINEKPPGIRRFTTTMKKAAGKIGKTLRDRGKKKSSTPD